MATTKTNINNTDSIAWTGASNNTVNFTSAGSSGNITLAAAAASLTLSSGLTSSISIGTVLTIDSGAAGTGDMKFRTNGGGSGGAFKFIDQNFSGNTTPTLTLSYQALTIQSGSTMSSSGAITFTAGAASTWSTSSGALTVDSASALNLGTSAATSVSLGRSGQNITSNGPLIMSSAATIAGTAPASAADKVQMGVVDIDGAGTAALKNIYEGGSIKVERVEGSVGSLNIMHIARNFADDETLTLPIPTNFGVLDIYSVDNASQGNVTISSTGSINSTPLSGVFFSASDSDGNLCVYDGGTAAVLKNRLGSTKFLIGTYRWN